MGNQACSNLKHLLEQTDSSPSNWELSSKFLSQSLLTSTSQSRGLFMKDFLAQFKDEQLIKKIPGATNYDFDFHSESLRDLFEHYPLFNQSSSSSQVIGEKTMFSDFLRLYKNSASQSKNVVDQLSLMVCATYLRYFVVADKVQHDVKSKREFLKKYNEAFKDIMTANKEASSSEGSLPEGKRRLMISLLQGLLADVVEAQNPDETDILEEILFKAKSLSAMVDASHTLSDKEFEIEELLEELIKQVINLVLLQTQSLNSFSKLSKDDCQTLVNFVCCLTRYVAKASVSMDTLSRIIQFELNHHFKVPPVSSSTTDSRHLVHLEKSTGELRLDTKTFTGDVCKTLTVLADSYYYYLHEKKTSNHQVHVCKRSFAKQPMAVDKTISIDGDKICYFDGKVWAVHTTDLTATELSILNGTNVARSIKLAKANLESCITSQWQNHKLGSSHLVSIAGDQSDKIHLVYFCVTKHENSAKKCIVIVQQQLSATEAKAEVTWTKLALKEQGSHDAVDDNSHNHESVCFTGIHQNHILLTYSGGRLTLINLDSLIASESCYATAQAPKDLSATQWSGYDPLHHQILSIQSDGVVTTTYIHLLPVISSLVSSTEEQDGQNSSLLAEKFGLVYENCNLDITKKSEADDNKISPGSIENIRDAVFSLLQQCWGHYSIWDFPNIEDCTSTPEGKESFKKYALQRNFQLDTTTFRRLIDIATYVGDSQDANLGLQTLVLASFYLTDIYYLSSAGKEAAGSDELKFMTQKDLFYLRVALEKISRMNISRLNLEQQAIFEDHALTCFIMILRQSQSIKEMSWERFAGLSFKSKGKCRLNSLDLSRAFIGDLLEGQSESRFIVPSISIVAALIKNFVESSDSLISKETELIRKSFQSKTLVNYDDSDFNQKWSLCFMVPIFLSSYQFLPEDSQQLLNDLGKLVSKKFLALMNEIVLDQRDRGLDESMMTHFDHMLKNSLTMHIFYHYFFSLVFDKENSSVEFDDLCDSLIKITNLLPKPEKITQVTAPDTVFEFAINDSLEKANLVKFKKVYLPQHAELSVAVEGLDSRYDSVILFTLQPVSNPRVCAKQTKTRLLVPYESVLVDKTVVIPTNEVVILIKTELSRVVDPRTIKVQITGHSFSEFSDSILEILALLCRQKHRCEIEAKSGDESKDKALCSVFDSAIFFNGLQLDKYQPAKFKEDNQDSPTTLLEKCTPLYKRLLHLVNIGEEHHHKLDDLAKCLQNNLKKTVVHGDLMGEFGMMLTKAVLALTLYHDSRIEDLCDGMLDSSLLENDWRLCTAVRLTCRSLESDSQFEELFSKMLLIASTQPLKSNEKPLSGTKLSTTKSMMVSLGPQKVTAAKEFQEQMKIKQLSQSKSKATCFADQILKFLKLKIEAAEVVTFVRNQQVQSDAFQSILEMVETWIQNSSESVDQTLMSINQVLRKGRTFVDFVSPDYSGLSQPAARRRVKSLQKLISFVLQTICSESTLSKQTMLLALDSLKWLWRPQEAICVASIDLEAIIDNNVKLCCDVQVEQSLIELCVTVLRFCSDKPEIKDSVRFASDDQVINSVQQVLSTAINYLCDVTRRAKGELDKSEPAEFWSNLDQWNEKRDMLKEGRLVDKAIQELAALDLEVEYDESSNFLPIVHNVNHLDYIDGAMIITNKSDLEPETRKDPVPLTAIKRQESNVSGVGWLFDDNEAKDSDDKKPEMTSTITDSTRETTSKKLAAWFKDNQHLIKRVQNCNRCFLHLFDFVAVTQVSEFVDKHHLQVFEDICAAKYPSSLITRCLNLLSVCHVFSKNHFALEPIRLFRSYLDDFTTPNHPGKEEILGHKRTLLRQFLYEKQLRDEVVSILKSSKFSEIMATLEFLDFTFGTYHIGSLVYELKDKMKEPYIILPKTRGLESEAFHRNYLFHNKDLRLAEKIREGEISKKAFADSILTISMRTKNYRYFRPEEIGHLHPYICKHSYAQLLGDLHVSNLMEHLNVHSIPGLYVLHRLAEMADSCNLQELKVKICQLMANKVRPTLMSTDHMCPDRSKVVARNFLINNLQVIKDDFAVSMLSDIQVPRNDQYDKIKNKILFACRQMRGFSSIIPTTFKPQDANLYYFGKNKETDKAIWTTTESSQTSGHSSETVKSMLYRLVTLKVEQWKPKSDSKNLSAKEFLVLLWEEHSLRGFFTSLQNLRAQLSSVNQDEKDRCSLISFLTEVAFQCLFDAAFMNNLWTTKIFIYCVEIIAQMTHACVPSSIDLTNAEDKFDRLLDQVITSEVDSKSYCRIVQYESLQNVFWLFSRCLADILILDCDKLRNKQKYDWLKIQNEGLKSICLPDEKQERNLIKGIFHWILTNQEDKFDSPWKVSLSNSCIRKQFKFADYSKWLHFSKAESKSTFQLFRDESSKLPFKIHFQTSKGEGDLGIASRIEVEPNSTAYVENSSHTNYALTTDLYQLWNLLGGSLVETDQDGRLTSGCNTMMIVKGKAYYIDDEMFIPMFEGVSLCERNKNYGALYLETNKQLVIFTSTNVREFSKLYSSKLLTEDRLAPHEIFDLSLLPKIIKILLVVDDFFVVLKAEDNSIVMFEKKHDHTKEINCAAAAVRNLLHLLYGHPVASSTLEGAFEVMKPTDNIEMMSIEYNHASCLLVIEHAEGAVAKYYTEQKKSVVAIPFNGDKVKRIVSYDDEYYLQLASKKIFCTKELEIPDNGGSEVKYYTIDQPYFSHRNSQDIILHYRNKVLSIEQANSAAANRRIVSIHGSDFDGNDDFGGVLTAESKFMEIPKFDSKQYCLINTKAREYNTILDQCPDQVKSVGMPAVLFKADDSMTAASLDNLATVMELKPRLFLIMRRAVIINDSWSDLLADYESSMDKEEDQGREFDPQDITTASCAIWSPTRGTVVLMVMPENLDELGDYVYLFKSSRVFTSQIKVLIERLSSQTKFVYNPGKGSDQTIEFFPDIYSMADADFDEFKEKHRDLWERHLEQIKSEFFKYKDIFLSICMRNLDNDPEYRSEPYEMIKKVDRFFESKEYKKFEQRLSNVEGFDKKMFSKVVSCMQVMNFYYKDYFFRLPLFEGRCLDMKFNEKAQANVMATFFLANFKPRSGSASVTYVSMNKFKALKEVKLQFQNYSLINQLWYEVDNDLKQMPEKRKFIERIKYQLEGEGRKDLTRFD